MVQGEHVVRGGGKKGVRVVSGVTTGTTPVTIWYKVSCQCAEGWHNEGGVGGDNVQKEANVGSHHIGVVVGPGKIEQGIQEGAVLCWRGTKHGDMVWHRTVYIPQHA